MAIEPGKVSLAVVGLLLSGVTGYFSAQAAIGERVRAVEVRQEEQYRALVSRIDDMGSRTQQGHDNIRMDLQGIRSEIMAILKER